MSEAARPQTRTKVPNRAALPIPPPPSPIAKTARERKSIAARQAGRAAQRAINRTNAVLDADEVDTLQAQIDELDELSDEDSAKEYAIIKARFAALAGEHNSKIATEANKDLSFTCAICFDDCSIFACTGLRILTPCGHGFCAGCIATHMCDDAPISICPNCRMPITSVMPPFF